MDSTITGLDTGAARKRLQWAAVVTWLPAVSMMLVSTISYIDRNTLALLAPAILRDTHLSNEQYGFIISGFSIAYMLCNPLWGWIVDRIGVRMSMSVAVSLWTLASVSHAFAAGFRGFLAVRTALGCGEGATYPGAVRTVTQTLPAAVRMRGIGVVYCGGSFGALLTPIVITPVAAAWGWRAAFWFTGAAGALWLALWAVLSRRRDLARPPVAVVETGGKPRWNDRRLWAFMAAYALGASPIAFVLYQASIYLSATFHKSQLEIGHVLWVPPLGWEFGMLFWGWATDRFAKAGASLQVLRRQFLLAMVLSLPLAAVPRVGSYPITLGMLSFAMFVTGGFGIGSLAYAARHYSMNHSGLIVGLGSGSWSAVVALQMPLVGKLFDLHWYGGAFALATLFPVIGYGLWRALDR
jgi:ACS family hexuronate transporter-like MFS transporter